MSIFLDALRTGFRAGPEGVPGMRVMMIPVHERQDTQTLAQQPSPASDAQLVVRAREGDRRAFRLLVERYEQDMAGTAVAMLGPGPDVDDVVQDVFIRFYQTLDQFRGESGVRTYLKRITINRCLDVLRKRKRFYKRFVEPRTPEEPVGAVTADDRDPLESQEQAALVHRAIQSLSPRHREVVVLRLIEGCSTRETADILGIAYGTVLSRLSRAQTRLKAYLSPLINHPGALPDPGRKDP